MSFCRQNPPTKGHGTSLVSHEHCFCLRDAGQTRGRGEGGDHLVELEGNDHQQFVQSLLLLSLIGLQGLLGSVQIGRHNFYLNKAM